MQPEGVIKYQLDFVKDEPVQVAIVKEVNAWRSILLRLGLVGQNEALYQGAGYGNLSCRLDNTDAFVITGSQTGEILKTDHRHYATVIKSDVRKNYLCAKGPLKPSSEALSHAAIYKALCGIRYVFHVHSDVIWNQAAKLDIPVIAPEIAYGTVEMAEEITRLCMTDALRHGGLFSMGGHEDGVIAFGKTAAATGTLLIETLVAAQLAG